VYGCKGLLRGREALRMRSIKLVLAILCSFFSVSGNLSVAAFDAALGHNYWGEAGQYTIESLHPHERFVLASYQHPTVDVSPNFPGANCLDWHPSGNFIAMTGSENSNCEEFVLRYNKADGKLIRFSEHNLLVSASSCSWSKKGDMLALATSPGDNGTPFAVRRFSPQSGVSRSNSYTAYHNVPFQCTAFNPVYENIVIVAGHHNNSDQTGYTWSGSGSNSPGLTADTDAGCALRLYEVTGNDDGTIGSALTEHVGCRVSPSYVQNSQSKNVNVHIGHVAWHPSGNYFVVGFKGAVSSHADFRIYHYDHTNKRVQKVGDFDPGFEGDCAKWSPDGKYIAFTCSAPWRDVDPRLEVRKFDADDTSNPLQVSHNSQETGYFSAVCLSCDWHPTEPYLAVVCRGDGDYTLKVFRVEVRDNGDPVLVDLHDHMRFNLQLDVRQVQWSPDGSVLGIIPERPQGEGVFTGPEIHALTFPRELRFSEIERRYNRLKTATQSLRASLDSQSQGVGTTQTSRLARWSKDNNYLATAHEGEDHRTSLIISKYDRSSQSFSLVDVLPSPDLAGRVPDISVMEWGPDNYLLVGLTSHDASPGLLDDTNWQYRKDATAKYDLYKLDTSSNTLVHKQEIGTWRGAGNVAWAASWHDHRVYFNIGQSAFLYDLNTDVERLVHFKDIALGGDYVRDTESSNVFSHDGTLLALTFDSAPYVRIFEVDSADSGYRSDSDVISLFPHGAWYPAWHPTQPYLLYRMHQEGESKRCRILRYDATARTFSIVDEFTAARAHGVTPLRFSADGSYLINHIWPLDTTCVGHDAGLVLYNFDSAAGRADWRRPLYISGQGFTQMDTNYGNSSQPVFMGSSYNEKDSILALPGRTERLFEAIQLPRSKDGQALYVAAQLNDLGNQVQAEEDNYNTYKKGLIDAIANIEGAGGAKSALEAQIEKAELANKNRENALRGQINLTKASQRWEEAHKRVAKARTLNERVKMHMTKRSLQQAPNRQDTVVTGRAKSLSWSRDGQWCAAAISSMDGTTTTSIKLYQNDPATMALTEVSEFSISGMCKQIAWDQATNGTWLAVVHEPSETGVILTLLKREDNALIYLSRQVEGSLSYNALAWHPKENKFLAAGPWAHGFVARCYEVDSGANLRVFVQSEVSQSDQLTDDMDLSKHQALSVAWDPQGEFALIGIGLDAANHNDFMLVKYDGTSFTHIAGYDPSRAGFTAAWSPDGKQILFGSDNYSDTAQNTLAIANFDYTNPQVINPAVTLHTHTAIRKVSWAPDGKYFAYTDGAEVRLGVSNPAVNQLGMVLTKPLSVGSRSIDDIAWSPDGLHLAVTWCADKAVTEVGANGESVATTVKEYKVSFIGLSPQLAGPSGFYADLVQGYDQLSGPEKFAKGLELLPLVRLYQNEIVQAGGNDLAAKEEVVQTFVTGVVSAYDATADTDGSSRQKLNTYLNGFKATAALANLPIAVYENFLKSFRASSYQVPQNLDVLGYWDEFNQIVTDMSLEQNVRDEMFLDVAQALRTYVLGNLSSLSQIESGRALSVVRQIIPDGDSSLSLVASQFPGSGLSDEEIAAGATVAAQFQNTMRELKKALMVAYEFGLDKLSQATTPIQDRQRYRIICNGKYLSFKDNRIVLMDGMGPVFDVGQVDGGYRLKVVGGVGSLAINEPLFFQQGALLKTDSQFKLVQGRGSVIDFRPLFAPETGVHLYYIYSSQVRLDNDVVGRYQLVQKNDMSLKFFSMSGESGEQVAQAQGTPLICMLEPVV
jgi:Tol biopolymer transport system component